MNKYLIDCDSPETAVRLAEKYKADSVQRTYGSLTVWLTPKQAEAIWKEPGVLHVVLASERLKDYYLVKRATVSNGQWIPDGSDEITVKRALGYEGYSDDEAKDIRNWVPWWPVNSIVRIIERWDDVDNQMRWFIAEPMIYTGKPETATLRHHPTDGIVQCVWQ